MGSGRVIKAKKTTGVSSGEIKRVPRDTRIAAIKMAERLPPEVKVTWLYSILYDSDTRVRNFAQETLAAVSGEDVSAFIARVGQPRVVDFLAHNLPKDSPALGVIASAPSLAKRTREYLRAIGVTPQKGEAEISPALETAEPAGAGSESSEDSLEWTPLKEVELPPEVEFSMPIEDDGLREETVPALEERPEPTARRKPSPKPPHPIKGADSPVEEKPRQVKPPVIPPSPGKPQSEGLFPVYEEVSAKETAEAIKRTDATEAAAVVEVPLEAGRGMRRDFLRGILSGLLIGFMLVTAFILTNHYAPNWPTILNNLKSRWSREVPKKQAPSPPAPADTATEAATKPTPTPPVKLLLGTYISKRAWKHAQKKAESLGLVTKTTQKKKEKIVYSVVSSASGSRDDAMRRVRGIRSLGIPASLGRESNGRWHIFCGSLPSENEARKRAIALRASGYPAGVTKGKRKKTTYTLLAVDVQGDKKEEIMARLKNAGFEPREMH